MKENNINNIDNEKTTNKDKNESISVYTDCCENSVQLEQCLQEKHKHNNINNIDNDNKTNIHEEKVENELRYEDFSQQDEKIINNNKTEKTRRKLNEENINNIQEDKNKNNKVKKKKKKRNNIEKKNPFEIFETIGNGILSFAEFLREHRPSDCKEETKSQKQNEQQEAQIQTQSNQQIGCCQKFCNVIKKIFSCCNCCNKNNQTKNINNLNIINKIEKQEIITNQI